MPYCAAVCKYQVMFSDGTVLYPSLPGHADVYTVANQYARESLSKGKDVPVSVVSIRQIL